MPRKRGANNYNRMIYNSIDVMDGSNNILNAKSKNCSSNKATLISRKDALRSSITNYERKSDQMNDNIEKEDIRDS